MSETIKAVLYSPKSDDEGTTNTTFQQSFTVLHCLPLSQLSSKNIHCSLSAAVNRTNHRLRTASTFRNSNFVVPGTSVFVLLVQLQVDSRQSVVRFVVVCCGRWPANTTPPRPPPRPPPRRNATQILLWPCHNASPSSSTSCLFGG